MQVVSLINVSDKWIIKICYKKVRAMNNELFKNVTFWDTLEDDNVGGFTANLT